MPCLACEGLLSCPRRQVCQYASLYATLVASLDLLNPNSKPQNKRLYSPKGPGFLTATYACHLGTNAGMGLGPVQDLGFRVKP